MVTAPAETCEDVERVKTQVVVHMMHRTIFPTGIDDCWQVSNSAHHIRTAIRITKLPVICCDESLFEMLPQRSLDINTDRLPVKDEKLNWD